MALLYRAELNPGKLDLLAGWLPTRSWFGGSGPVEVNRVAACRFDDPAGEVGIETLVVQAGNGPRLHTPLTYRGTPLDGGERWLVGTTEHSVLGTRWVYDACGDPVYAQALAHAILTGGRQAEEFVEVDGRAEHRTPAMVVRGSGGADTGVAAVDRLDGVDDGDPTIIRTGQVELTVVRVLDAASPATGEGGQLSLAGTWSGQPTPLILARARAI